MRQVGQDADDPLGHVSVEAAGGLIGDIIVLDMIGSGAVAEEGGHQA